MSCLTCSQSDRCTARKCSVPSLYVKKDGVTCLCRKGLAFLAGTYEGDAIEETFHAPICELDCEGCPG